jgi:hypothetical protein
MARVVIEGREGSGDTHVDAESMPRGVRFELDGGEVFTVRFDGDGVQVRKSSGSLAVYPEVSNCVGIQ